SPDPTGAPSQPKRGRCSKPLRRVVSGFVRNWIAVHAVQQSNPNKKRKNMTTLHLRKSIGRSPLPRRNFTKGGSLITVLLLPLCCFAPSSVLQAVTPARDGGYFGFNTAEGTDALYSLTPGTENTAIGYDALYYDTIGA